MNVTGQGWVSDSLKPVYDKTRRKLCPKPVYTASLRQFRTMMIVTYKYDKITGIMKYY